MLTEFSDILPKYTFWLPMFAWLMALVAMGGFMVVQLLVLIVSTCTNIRMYTLTKKAQVTSVTQKAHAACYRDGEPTGFIWNMTLGFVGYVTTTQGRMESSPTTSTVHILCKMDTFDAIKRGDGMASTKSVAPTLSFVDTADNTIWASYTNNTCEFPYIPKTAQQSIIDHIVREKPYVTLIHGAPGTGKSMVAMLLAYQLGSKYASDYSPIEPGDSFGELYAFANPTADKPLIVAIEEVDDILRYIHDGKCKTNNHARANVHSKSTWNTWLDQIRIRYPHARVIMTMNSTLDEMNQLDSAYLRDGRVNYIASS